MIKLSLEEIIQRLPAVYGNGRYGEADAICQQALAQGACHFMLYYVKGLLCYRKGDVQQAQNLIQEAEQLNPSLAAYHHLTGLLKQRNNNDWLTIQETRLDVFQRMAQTDGYILSYPKCGRTWLRMLIGHYLGNKTPGANYFDVWPVP